jgi:hypothetical protein
MPPSDVVTPTYGNWRRPSSPGLGSLGFGGTVAMLGGLTLVIFGLMISVMVGVVLLVVVLVALAPLVYRDRWHRSGYERMAEWFQWTAHKRKGHHLYVAGPLSRMPTATCGLPGLAAAMTVTERPDAHGRPFVLLHHPTPGHVSTVVECGSSGAEMVDSDQVDQWVAGWGAWLADLGHEEGLVGASVTVETAPDTGIRLRHAVESRLVPDAPPMAVASMREIVETFPAGAAATTCRLTLTWTRARPGGRRRSVDDMAIEIGSRLPELTNALATTGAGSARPMTAAGLAKAIRVAYDPDVATAMEAAGPEAGDVTWADAGPVQAEERPGEYLHDGSVSVSWVMGEAPRGAVRSTILRRLLEPHPEIARKRVTLLYRPYTPSKAAELVDNDVLDAQFNATQRRNVRARDSVNVSAAAKAAEEEALGAGLVRFASIVTATVADDGVSDTVSRAVSVIEHLGGASRIRLRRAWRAQAPTFTAGLPLGLVLPAHLRLPGDWRERV